MNPQILQSAFSQAMQKLGVVGSNVLTNVRIAGANQLRKTNIQMDRIRGGETTPEEAAFEKAMDMSMIRNMVPATMGISSKVSTALGIANQKFGTNMMTGAVHKTGAPSVKQLIEVVIKNAKGQNVGSKIYNSTADAQNALQRMVIPKGGSAFPREVMSAIQMTKQAGSIQAKPTTTFYHGANKTVGKGELKYNTYLTVNKQEALDYANMRTKGRGGKPVVNEFKFNPNEVALNKGTGEYQYKGASASLKGSKYPSEVYKAYNDYTGGTSTAKEIDKMPLEEVRDYASGGLSGGRKAFDKLIKKLYGR